jgi:uncharacterized peroxidase-related enzyme
MAFVAAPAGVPGIVSLFALRPDLGQAMNGVAEALLRGPSSLSPAERELIATHVSAQNCTEFCQRAHGATAAALLGEDAALAEAVRTQGLAAPVSPKLRALLQIAGLVAQSGLAVTEAAVAEARAEGATDDELHQTVAIAAAFSMFNRYVDGLRAWSPTEPEIYAEIGHMLATQGYRGSGAPA